MTDRLDMMALGDLLRGRLAKMPNGRVFHVLRGMFIGGGLLFWCERREYDMPGMADVSEECHAARDWLRNPPKGMCKHCLAAMRRTVGANK